MMINVWWDPTVYPEWENEEFRPLSYPVQNLYQLLLSVCLLEPVGPIYAA